jgi:thiamine biosynthesis lipoprotein
MQSLLTARMRAGWRGLLALCLLVLLGACSRPAVWQQEAYVFGTRVQLSLYDVAPAQAEPAMAAVLQEFSRLHHAYHAWQPSSLTELNAALAAGERHPVSAEMAQLLRAAQHWSARSDGLFDPAMGGLVALWGFHSDEFLPRLPAPEHLAAWQAASPSMADVVIDGEWVSSRNPAVQFDFGGLAKGYALDRAAAILREHGIANALVNIGGNVIALGAKGRAPWRIGIQHPRGGAPLAVLPLYDGEAIGTTGDYQRYFIVDGQRHAHVLDPRSARPADRSQSLTVLVTPRVDAGLVSDVASKPPFIVGDDWLPMLHRLGVQHGLRVAADGRLEASRAMRLRLQLPDDSPAVAVLD